MTRSNSRSRRDHPMANRNSISCLICLALCMVLNTGCQTNRGTGSRNMPGGIEIRDEQLKGQWPAEVPRTIYVSDFALDVQHIESDEGVRGILPGRRGQGVLGQLGQRLPHRMARQNPADQARKIVDAMARSLITSLEDKGFAARRLPRPGTTLPHDGWLLQGVFTEVDEGNRIKRAVIGFGRGATSMDVQVGISDLAGTDPRAPFIVFGTVEDPKKIPGAIVTMNPYVAAARFVMEKNATEKDIRKTAEQIVDEILKHGHKFEEQARSNKPPTR